MYRGRAVFLLLALLVCSLVAVAHTSGTRRILRVCADPNNLPFSNDRGEGFENKLAELLAREMGAQVHYTWSDQRRELLPNTLRAGSCDVVMGVPSTFELARPTKPYYRSSYAFVYPARATEIQSLDDPQLHTLRIGVHVIGEDYATVPPAHALARRGIVTNVVGYSIYGNYADPDPPARLVEAVARGEVDVAIVWGPLAGFAARRQPVALKVTPIAEEDAPALPFVYDVSIGVRRDDKALQEELDAILTRKAIAIDALLDEYGVPYSRDTRRGAARAVPSATTASR